MLSHVDRLIGQEHNETVPRSHTTTETPSTLLSDNNATLKTEAPMLNASMLSGDVQAEPTRKTGENRSGELVSERHNAQESSLESGLRQAEASRTTLNEQNGRGRLDEMRSRRRSSSVDMRDSRNAHVHNESAVREQALNLRVMPQEGSREISLELRLPNQGQDAPLTRAETSWEVRAGHAFEDILARELHQNFNNDIVRHASVMLRESGEGIIKLALKPESLGNVKIRLEMTENKITGIIIVESEEALRAFEREISSLEKAFRDSGYDGANLEMSLAADGREMQQQWQTNRSLPYAADRYDAAAEFVEIPLILDVYHQGAMAVNMLA